MSANFAKHTWWDGDIIFQSLQLAVTAKAEKNDVDPHTQLFNYK